jgi:hypothetical protein
MDLLFRLDVANECNGLILSTEIRNDFFDHLPFVDY